MKQKYPTNIVLGYLNINSIRNKFENLQTLIDGKVDILAIAETKLDASFTSNQFTMEGYKKPLRLDCSGSSGGLLVYVKSDLLVRQLSNHTLDEGIEFIVFEINLRKRKWLVIIIYRNPSKTNKDIFIQNLSNTLDFYTADYDDYIIAGDFNLEPENDLLKTICEDHNLTNLIKEKTCWKSKSGTCIDLILTNRKNCFQFSQTWETGLSDHHRLIYTMFKSTFVKLPPTIIRYRQYKNFDQTRFLNELYSSIGQLDDLNCDIFIDNFVKLLDQYAPIKTKYVRANNKQHVTKELRKQIMLRSKLKHIADSTDKPEDRARYKRQRNLVVNMNRKAKKSLFNSDSSKANSKGFWKTCKPLFSEKGCSDDKRIQLIENDQLVSDDDHLAEIFNEFYNSITDRIDIPSWNQEFVTNETGVKAAILKYENHPSILKIKENTSVDESTRFDFSPITESSVIKTIHRLNQSKSVGGGIPIRILKAAKFVCAPFLTSCFNSILNSGSFPDSLKIADIIPVHKKDSKQDKANYRPVSLLPCVSKVYERLIAQQLTDFLNPRFSKFLCGFRKNYSTESALLNMIRNWQNSLSNSNKIGAILMDLSKAFDCLPHDLLVAKLHAYGMGSKSLTLLHGYLSNRRHRVRIGTCFSSYLNLDLGVPQGSVLGPILFNIFINDLFYSVNGKDLCNFADDNTLHKCGATLDHVIAYLKSELDIILFWYKTNSLVANPDKFQLIFPGTRNANIIINIGSFDLNSSETVKLLGVTIDSQLSFLPHVKDICKKVSTKTKVILRIRAYLDQDQADTLFNSYILSTLRYCPLVWMFCCKQAHTLIANTHFRSLRARQFNFKASYEQLLKISECRSVHVQNLQLMLQEVYKSINHIGPILGWDAFELMDPKPPSVDVSDDRKTLDLRCGDRVKLPFPKNAVCINSFDFRAGAAWNRLPKNVKTLKTLNEFNSAVKGIKIYCSCKLCSVF